MLGLLSCALGIVGTVGAGVWAIETRYVHQTEYAQHLVQVAEQRTETAQQIRNVQLDILESRRQSINRDLFPLEQRAKAGGLTVDEQRYLHELRQQQQDTNEKIQRLSR